MIQGVVSFDREAVIRFFVFGEADAMHEIEASVDTGFTEDLTLPEDLVDALKLPFKTVDYTVLADGNITSCRIHEAEILWDGNRRSILVQVSETAPLAGMGLLQGYLLTVECREGGEVRITPL